MHQIQLSTGNGFRTSASKCSGFLKHVSSRFAGGHFRFYHPYFRFKDPVYAVRRGGPESLELETSSGWVGPL